MKTSLIASCLHALCWRGAAVYALLAAIAITAGSSPAVAAVRSPTLGRPMFITNANGVPETWIELRGESNKPYVVVMSTNLLNWTPVITNDEPSEVRMLKVQDVSADRMFYQATALMPMFSFALAANETIDLNSNLAHIDSFDSHDPSASTNARYDALKARDGGDLFARHVVWVGNGNVYGRVYLPPWAQWSVGPNGAVGSKAWQMASSFRGVEPGWILTNANVRFTAVPGPAGSFMTPAAGTVEGMAYDYVLDTGSYALQSVGSNQSVYVRGDAKLLVRGNVYVLATNAGITFGNDAALHLFVEGPECSLSGGGVRGHHRPEQFMVFGRATSTPTATMRVRAVEHAFTGCVYAPDAAVSLSGTNDMAGAVVGRTVSVGSVKLHYDEALRTFTP